ncbi:aspartyl protease family protein [Prunus yedoensis var. nudiflora]|uniref:Aspartyl protease family protein n=1 Tax=Prunus yedoensis var. nudiflora TaxID=2094558 RepID=A0A314Z4Q6_PRUYE|nr:aspartyl protease family protein [Prunus yedoensis var. nudiflora]
MSTRKPSYTNQNPASTFQLTSSNIACVVWYKSIQKCLRTNHPKWTDKCSKSWHRDTQDEVQTSCNRNLFLETEQPAVSSGLSPTSQMVTFRFHQYQVVGKLCT